MWCYITNIKALCFVVSEMIFKDCSFGCHGNQSSSWNGTIWELYIGHHLRNIHAKFHHQWFWRRRCLSKLLTHDGRRRTTDTARSQKLTLALCARWAKNTKIDKTVWPTLHCLLSKIYIHLCKQFELFWFFSSLKSLAFTIQKLILRLLNLEVTLLQTLTMDGLS